MNSASDPRRPDKVQSMHTFGSERQGFTDTIFGLTLIANGKYKIQTKGILGIFLAQKGGSKEGKELRYKGSSAGSTSNPGDDPTPDYMNVLGMIFSMCGLMMRLKWCAWVALYCSCISFANSRINDDTKQILSSFMLSISAVVMSYLQNPQPMVPPWSSF